MLYSVTLAKIMCIEEQLTKTVTPHGGEQYRSPFSKRSIFSISSLVKLTTSKLLVILEGVTD